MGNVTGGINVDMLPDHVNGPKHDPLEGFPNGRKQRVMIATEQEMMAAKLPHSERDYCAHHAISIELCRLKNYPWVARCKAETNAWNDCQYEDFVLRMKEYERERRLIAREKRRQQAGLA